MVNHRPRKPDEPACLSFVGDETVQVPCIRADKHRGRHFAFLKNGTVWWTDKKKVTP